MGKQYLSSRIKSFRAINKGFTLIELLVVITMIGVMVSFLVLYLNPLTQIEKARDAQRLQNLKQVNNALDSYYNDNNCYPASLSFGTSWEQGSTVYMKEVPQDPSCPEGSCFTYLTDTRPSSCPAWNIMFTKLYQVSANSSTCVLEANCRPSNYDASGYNYCFVSGTVDCAYLSSLSLPPNAGAGTGGNGSGGGPTATPTPAGSTPTPTPACSLNYSCTGNPLRCNVIAPAGSGQYCASNCNGACP